MNRLILLTISFFTIAILAKPSFGAPRLCKGTVLHPCIVQDTYSSIPLTYWRDAYMISEHYTGDTTGLRSLWMSGSAAPSARAWPSIQQKIKNLTHGKVKKIIILDLRQESHGYLNQNAITLATTDDWINRGKTREATLQAEQNWLSSLSKKNTILNVLTPAQFKTKQFAKGKNVQVNNIASEQEVAQKFGFEYFRLTVSDHMKPNNEDIDRFVNFIKQLPPNTWVHMHCRGGKGRTTTFLAMYDMLRNAKQVSFDDIINRHADVPPFYDLSQVNRTESAYTTYYKERLQFLKNFYQFANARLNGYQGNWSAWIAKN